MALQKDTVSINLAKSINTKTDEKIAQADQMSILRNARFNEDLALEKRNGMVGQSLNFQGDPGFAAPVAFDSATFKSKTFAHENQLCVANNGNLFSQNVAQNKWIFKGTYVPIEITDSKLDPTITFTDVVTVSGVTVTIGGANIYVLEESTGNIIKKTLLAGTETCIRVVGFASSVWILTTDTVTTNLYMRQVNLTDGSIGSTVTAANNYTGYAVSGHAIPAVAVTSSSSAIGEAAFITYYSATTQKVVPFLSSGSVSALGTLTTALSSSSIAAITIEPSVNANRFYLALVSFDQAHVVSYTFTSSAYTLVYTANAGTISNNGNNNVAAVLSPINNSDLYVFFDSIPNSNGFAPVAVDPDGYSDDAFVQKAVISNSGSVTTFGVYGLSMYLAAQPIRDTTRTTIYLPCVYQSPLQTTILLTDILEGNAEGRTYVIGKTLYGLGSVPPLGYLAQTKISNGVSYRTTNNGYFINFNFAPENAAQSQYLANTTHLTGGLLWAYDGDTIAEHNFLIGPEHLQATAQTNYISVSLIRANAYPITQRFSATFGPAIGLKKTSNQYFTFQSVLSNESTAVTQVIWYTVDGVGTDPGVAGNHIQVSLLSSDDANTVAFKTKLAIVNASVDVFSPQLVDNTLTITNTFSSVGSLTAPAVGGTGPSGNLSAGSYEYAIVWKWTDRNGQTYRSAQSVPIVVTATAGSAGVVVFWAPPITNKQVDTVFTEIYRTQVNGLELQLVDEVAWDQDQSRFAYIDTNSDADIADNRIIYTSGGILNNSNIGACSTICFFKERLVVAGVEDQYAVYYSKSIVPGEPVNFTEETFFRVDADAFRVTAVAFMDDKLCVFKKPYVYALSGDGANDLGEGSTFSTPLLVASDAGSSNPNSVVLYPNGLLFKSDKGIYNLNRALGIQYIGAPVEQYNPNALAAGVLMKEQTEIRFVLSDIDTALIYNYFYNRWDTFTNYQADSACVWQDTFCFANNAGRVFVENSSQYYDYNGTANVSYSMYLKTPWLRLKGVQDFQRIYRLAFLGEYRSPHTLTINVYYDYDSTNFDTYTFNGLDLVTGTFPGDSVYQPEIILNRQKCQSIQIEVFETPISGTEQSLVLNELGATVGLKKGLNKVPARKVQ